MPEVATPNQGEREFETGNDEFFKSASQVNASNYKRTYDVYQDLDIQAARQAQIETTRLNQIASQALQNAVETANLVSKAAVKHGDVAADGLWNPVQQGAGDVLTGANYPANRAVDVGAAGVAVSAEAVAASVANAVAAANVPLLAVLQQVVEAIARNKT